VDAALLPPPITIATAATQDVQVVQVRADPLQDPVAPRDTSVAGSVVPRDRLVGPGLEAQDVLRTQPGVAIAESGGFGAPATAAIRGATAADTPVYLAGVRLNDDVAGTADLSLVPLWLIDHVEVYRGNAPIEADRLGAGGAIFFEPRQPTRDMGGVGYYGGSWGASKGWAYEGFHAGPVAALVGVSGDRATNRYPFVNDQGELFEPGAAVQATRRNADETTGEAWGLARIDLGGGARADVLLNAVTRDEGVPSLAVLQTREARQTSQRTLGSLVVHTPIGGSDRATLDARTSVIVGRTDFHDPLMELTLYTKDLDVVGRRVEESLDATVRVAEGLEVRPQVDLAHEDIERTPDTIPLGQAHRDFARLAVGAQEDATRWLTLHVLGSLECQRTGQNPDGVCDVFAPTGRAGAEVGTERLRFVANAGHYVRVPTLGEVYGASGVVHGNPALEPEEGNTVDVGLRARSGSWGVLRGAYVDAFLFGRWADGLIAYEHIAQGFLEPYNVGRARVLGAEVLAGLLVTKVVRVEIATTSLDPRDTTPTRTTVNDVLPYRSKLVAAPRVRADWKIKGRDGLSSIGAEVRGVYQSSRYVDPAGLGIIPQQTTVDAEVDTGWFGGLLTARLRVADLFNANRTDIIGYPLPGRSIYFGLEASW
jgi:iron complex outermembrane receptor protein